MNEYSIGVDLGGTNLRAAAVNRDGQILEKISVDTDFEGGRDAVIKRGDLGFSPPPGYPAVLG